MRLRSKKQRNQMSKTNRSRFLRLSRQRLGFERLEDRRLLAFGHVFEDINPDTSDHDSLDPIGASGGRVNFLAGVPGDTQTFYAASEFGGLYKSTDGGQEWAHLDGHLPQVTWDVEVDPSNASRVYATSFYDGRFNPISGIQISTDAGVTWSHPPASYPDPALEGTPNDNTPQPGYSAAASRRQEPSAFGISIRPDAPNEVYVGINAGLAISLDSGATWQIVDPELGLPGDDGTARNVWDVVVQPAMPGFPVGIIDIIGDDGHLRSTDQGTTWTRPAATIVNAGTDGRDNDGDGNVDEAGETGTLPTGLSTIAVSPDESYVLFAAASDNDLYESDDAGATWTNLGTPDRRRQGRIPWVQTNQRSDAGMNDVFDVWFGDVGLFRASCTSQAALGGSPRCPAASTTPGTPPPPPWAGTFTRAAGAHDDVGDVVFDTTAATDACPLTFSNDGGIYYNNDTNSPSCHSPSWEEPDQTTHALWLFGMTAVDVPGSDDNEDLYFTAQDNGLFASTDAGAASPSWHNTWGADSFDVAADDDTVLYNRGSFGTPGRAFRMFLGAQGAPGLDPAGTEINTYPAGGTLPTFLFTETVANFADDSYVMLTADCTNPSAGGGTNNGCPIVTAGGSDGGVFITTNIKANPIVWTELVGNTPVGTPDEPFNSANLAGVQVAVDAGTPTFYVQVGGGDGRSADQLWKFVGTNPNAAWTQIDTNLPGNGIGIFGVDPNNSNRLYASADPTGTPGMFFSNDGGVTWNPDTNLDNLMQGGGEFQYLNQRGPTRFFGFNGYPQPSLVAFDAEDPNNIVAGGQDSGVFLSTDAGQSWRLLTDPSGAQDDPSTPEDDVPNIPRPRYAHFDHEPAGETRIILGSQGFGVRRIGVNFDKDPDQYEDPTNNDTIGTATILGSLPQITLNDLSTHNDADVDFYKVTARDTGKLIVNMFLNGLSGDLDIRVRDANGNIIATGTQSNIAPQLDNEQFVIPVVSQEEYFIEVFSELGHTNCYDLEIENFPAPVPSGIHLDPASDTGMMNNDNLTADDTPRFLIQADLRDFANMGITILDAAQADAGVTPGAAVNVVAVNSDTGAVVEGFADPVGSGNFLFESTLTNPLSDGVYFVSASVKIFDGQQDANGIPDPAMGETLLSEPLWITIDTSSPTADDGFTFDMLDASDSGMSMDDYVTNKMSPAFDGVAEAGAKIRIFAAKIINNVVQPRELIGQGVVNSDPSDGVPGNDLGSFEITVEPLVDAVYDLTVDLEDGAGNVTTINPDLGVVGARDIEIDSLGPNLPFLDLVEADDTGRHNDDNVTNITLLRNPDFTMTSEDRTANPADYVHLIAQNFKFRVFDRLEESTEILIYDSATDATIAGKVDGLTELQLLQKRLSQVLNNPNGLALADGIHNLKIEVEDRAGNISPDFLLDLLIDTVAYLGEGDLHPDSDSGVAGYTNTMADKFTNVKTPQFFGIAEANNLVTVVIDDVPAGTTVAVPADGDDAFQPPNAPYAGVEGNWQVLTNLNLADGEHTAVFTYEDLAGNRESSEQTFFVDTRGPQVTEIFITVDPAFNLFNAKPSDGPTPTFDQLSITVVDFPPRTAFGNYDALFTEVAENPGHYRVVGDHNGIIAIESVQFIPDPVVVGEPATGTIIVTFAEPLPDDRFTVTMSDSIVDPVGNALDGESNAAEPQDPPISPTGDGQPGGSAIARFTVDSRAELGVWAAGSVYVDTNGNFSFDPENQNNDTTNDDITYVLGFTTDNVFAGNFAAAAGATADGFDKLAAYGRVAGAFRWLIDTDNNGVPNLVVADPFEINGLPVAGNFDGSAANGDEVGLKNNANWHLDTDHDFNVETTLAGNMIGYPIVGDFDGDGIDDLGAWTDDMFSLDLSTVLTGAAAAGSYDANINGITDVQFRFGFPGVRERPVAADFDGDGIDDIGLWAPDRSGAVPQETSEWYIFISAGTPIPNRIIPNPQAIGGNIVDFTPVPFGNDLYAQFGDDFALPVVGNFDPPVVGSVPPQYEFATFTNPGELLDVNDDGFVTPVDALYVFNALNRGDGGLIAVFRSEAAATGPFFDPSADGYITPLDALMVINRLNAIARAEGEGEDVLILLSNGASASVADDSVELGPTFMMSRLPAGPTSEPENARASLATNRDRQDSVDAFFAQSPAPEASRVDHPLVWDNEQLDELLDQLADHLGGRQEWDESSPFGRL